MTVRPIRSTTRYAMRLPLRVQTAGARATAGLLIELSQDGARISNLGKAMLEEGASLCLALAGKRKLAGTVRWSHDGLAGIRLEPPLRPRELEELLDYNFACQQDEPATRYGT